MSRTKIQMGRIGSMRKMIAQAKQGREFSIVLSG